MKKLAFDKEMYLKSQAEHILNRIANFDNKLYLEFGGKLFDDKHANRVLPGFEPDIKLKLLLELKEEIEIIIAINANHIQEQKLRSDFEIGYDVEVLRLMQAFRQIGLQVSNVVITQYNYQSSVDHFVDFLKEDSVNVSFHYPIKDYPYNIDNIFGPEGFQKNDYIKTTKPLIIVTAPGPGSGKMATCLSQLYHEHQLGVKAGYAKFETFPIWNLSLQHPVNLAYEAATADLNDVNMIDPFHLEVYKETTTNYNRDIEIFPVLKALFERIYDHSPYQSPTDMGVNRAGFCIMDDEQARLASENEIIRRYFQARTDLKLGKGSEKAVNKIERIMAQAGISVDDRPVVRFAFEKASQAKQKSAFAMQLCDDTIIVGRQSELLSAPAACLLNALKYLAKIDADELLISPDILEPITRLKKELFGYDTASLNLEEVLMALSISSSLNHFSKSALSQIPMLQQADAHSTVLLEPENRQVLRKLDVYFTSTPSYPESKVYSDSYTFK